MKRHAGRLALFVVLGAVANIALAWWASWQHFPTDWSTFRPLDEKERARWAAARPQGSRVVVDENAWIQVGRRFGLRREFLSTAGDGFGLATTAIVTDRAPSSAAFLVSGSLRWRRSMASNTTIALSTSRPMRNPGLGAARVTKMMTRSGHTTSRSNPAGRISIAWRRSC